MKTRIFCYSALVPKDGWKAFKRVNRGKDYTIYRYVQLDGGMEDCAPTRPLTSAHFLQRHGQTLRSVRRQLGFRLISIK